MPVGELFLSSFLQVLFDRLASKELLNFARGEGVDLKLKKWGKTLKMIQAVLLHAEEKQLTDDAVKMWLDDLQDLAYHAEDILDEFETDALGRKVKAESGSSTNSKLRNLFPACCSGLTPTALKFNINMGSKIDRISSQLEELCEKRNALGLKDFSGGTSTTVWKRPESTSVPIEPAVFGREDDKAKILHMLLSQGSSEANFSVIPIVGMGGIGKTALAREVYNDDKVVEVFNTRAWTCVSDDFDVLRISKAIFESITASTCGLTNLNEVQVELKNEIAGRKFLLVLDDVWSKNYDLWEALKSPFMAGAPGSKIIVTTRSKEVASTMELEVCYNLKLLPEDVCWAIFEKHVSRSRVIAAGKNMEFIREKVVKKCKGLPLAARTLAGLLRSKQKYYQWEDILDSEIWDFPEESNILPILKLSYYHLPTHLKRCFAYCAIFPKDYEFQKKELVLLWMAEGLIQKANHKKQLEDLGDEYFCELLSRSIFQQLSNDRLKFVMHDLIHDLAQCISRETSFRFEDESSVMQIKRPERIRHCSYTFREYEVEKNFEVFHGVEQLRTFLRILLPPKSTYMRTYVSKPVFPNLLQKLRKLRSLSLTNYHSIELPDSIGDLKHLRYLNLSETQITNLPKSTSSLFNLQSLLLRNCSCLKKLPLQMGDLINLRHLDIRGAILIREIPLGVKKLKCLQTLSNFIVGKETGSSLKELKELKFLHGELFISGLENATDCQETRDIILGDKKDLEVLVLEWRSSIPARDEEAEKIVLDILEPHRNLKELTIKNFAGKRFSSWIGDPLFSSMVVLELDGCENCKTLPPIGLLGSLKNVTVKGIKMLEKIGCEVYGESCSECFQSLETLCFENLPRWEHWDPFEENELFLRFPSLKELSIRRCSKLSGRLPNRLPSLQKLVIRKCEQLVVSIACLPMLCSLQIDGCKGVIFSHQTDSQIMSNVPLLEIVVINECKEIGVSLASLPMLRSLEINGCKGMVCSGSNESMISEESNVPVFRSWTREGFQKLKTLRVLGWEALTYLCKNDICLEKPRRGLDSLTSLQELYLRELSNLVSFPDGSLSSLNRVEIGNCNAITSLHEGLKHNKARIQHLRVSGCPSLMFIVRGRLPSSLKTLRINECKKLVCIWDDREDTCTYSPSSSYSFLHKEDVDNTTTSLLCELSISHCPSLMHLSPAGQLPSTLTTLCIAYCSNLKTIIPGMQLPEALQCFEIICCPELESIVESFDNNPSLDHVRISRCENLKSFPKGLHTLRNLGYIDIEYCPNLVSFPKDGFPNSDLKVLIGECVNLQALPSHMHTLKSLQCLGLRNNPKMAFFPDQDIPTNLTSLYVYGPKIYNSLAEWGFHKLISLRTLYILGSSNAVSFPEEEKGMKLPASLIELDIESFPKLKYLSSEGFENLTSLNRCLIRFCPNLTSLPDFPPSLLQLFIDHCPMLKQRSKRDGGQEWSKIARIPRVEIDGNFIYEPEEEE